jgi:methylenetetrahydrofolate reductase (NADPH)
LIYDEIHYLCKDGIDMRITDVFKERMTFSFEVFPPKLDQPVEPLAAVLEDLYKFKPDYISCTYGAGGTNAGRNFEICHMIQQSGKSIPMCHFTCIGQTEESIKAHFDEFLEKGMNHTLALRGDLPAGWEDTRSDFSFATDLVRFIRKTYGDKLVISVAGSPEGHIQCRSLEADIAHLRSKQDLGADFITTQLTYDMDQFKRWFDAIRAAGITMPVVVGVMPVLNKDACIRMCLSTNGCAIPRKLARLISKYYEDPKSFRAAGIEYTIDQMYEYMDLGVNGLHLYALNKSDAVTELLLKSGLRTKE